MAGLILGLAGILLALAVPLLVEYSRRPVLRIELGEDVTERGAEPRWRMVHVRVLNEPLAGWRGRWLLRNAATSCRVTISFESGSSRSRVTMAGRWAASAEPRSLIGGPPEVPIEYYNIDPARAGIPRIELPFDPTKVPQTLRLDLDADESGEPVPVAIKFGGDNDAYGFTSESYAYSDARMPELRLAGREYNVDVEARTGAIIARRRFRLRNGGQAETDLQLEAGD